MACEAFIQPLNLECLLVNTFSGSYEVFIGLAYLFISFMAARFRMPNIIALVMFGLFAVFMSQFMQGLFFLIILISGIIIFYSISKIVKN